MNLRGSYDTSRPAEGFGMVIATLILVVSAGFFLFYLQVTCQKILKREFDQEYFKLIVSANRLEFPSVRRAVLELQTPVDYFRVRTVLKCDFLALNYLIKHAGKNVKDRFNPGERLLLAYFSALMFALACRYFLKLHTEPAVLRLTEVLQYLSNVVGERVSRSRFGSWTASDYLANA